MRAAGQLVSPAHRVTMLKPSLCPCFDLHMTPSVTAIVIGVASGMLTSWTVGFSRWGQGPGTPGGHFYTFGCGPVSRVTWLLSPSAGPKLRVFGLLRDPTDLGRSAGRPRGGDQSTQKWRGPPGLPRQRWDDGPAQSCANQEPGGPEGTF